MLHFCEVCAESSSVFTGDKTSASTAGVIQTERLGIAFYVVS